MKLARIVLAVLAVGLFFEPVVIQFDDAAIAATKKKKSGRDAYSKAQRAEHHKLATQICRKRYHTTTQVEVKYKQNGQISIVCWGN